MFKDYYGILNIEPDSSQEEIKHAFREQSKKWHPDKNQDTDTTERVQDINEAYIILKDPESRKKYDKEYEKFQKSDLYEEKRHRRDASSNEDKKSGQYKRSSYNYEGYKVSDETLEEWIQNAKRQAVELAKKSLKEFGEVSYEAAKEGAKGAAFQIASQVGCGIIILLVVLLYSFLSA